jgi:hypothetical protein
MGLGSEIRDPDLFRIPDPRVKKEPDPGSGSATLREIMILRQGIYSRLSIKIWQTGRKNTAERPDVNGKNSSYSFISPRASLHL